MSKHEFDRLFERLESFSVGFAPIFQDLRYESSGYPPHNISKVSDDITLIELAVAGFKKSEIEVKELNGEITVQGIKPESDVDSGNQFRGIANRSFVKRFKIAGYYEIDSVSLEDGLLTIKLVKNLPELPKPKVFQIK